MNSANQNPMPKLPETRPTVAPLSMVGCGGWLASLRRLRRLTVRRPGGGRLDEYSRGYDQAMADFAAAIRKEVDAANT